MALAAMQQPDHSTIAAFISSIQHEVVSLFCDILLVCEEQRLLGGTLFALDGLKLPSNASKHWSGTLDELTRKQEKLAAKIEHLLGEHQQVDSGSSPGNSRPPAIERTAETEPTRRQATEPLAAEHGAQSLGRTGGNSPKTTGADVSTPRRDAERLQRLWKQNDTLQHWVATHAPKIGKLGKEITSNVTDNESAMMSTSHGMIQGYNAQALVDDAHQVIVAAGVVGEGTDSTNLGPMVDQADQHLQHVGHQPGYFAGKTLLADTSYHSDDNLKYCETHQIDGYIPDGQFRTRDPRFERRKNTKPTNRRMFAREDFHYSTQEKGYLCPNGKVLRLRIRDHKNKQHIYRTYTAREHDCQACPLRERCLSGTKKIRRNLSVPVDSSPPTRSQRMMAKIDTPEARNLYSRRIGIVEPVFANIRTQKHLDRFTLRGKQKVDVQWMLYSMIHNIEKIANYGKLIP